jgi:integrase
MAKGRTVRDAKLETKTARLKDCHEGVRYWTTIKRGVLHLGYRRGRDGGSWIVRIYKGKDSGPSPYVLETIARADDDRPADGKAVLEFDQAVDLCRKKYAEHTQRQKQGADATSGALTVRKAVADYVEFLKAERKTGKDAEQRLALHILPRIGDKLVADLTKTEIERCKRAMVRTDAAGSEDERLEAERRSKDSANRVLSSLKAALNRAFEDESNGIISDTAWRRVKPFHDVGRARQVHLDREQANRLVNVCEGAFKNLITAALLTGARAPHELVNLRVSDFSAELRTLSIRDGKTGARDVYLTQEAAEFFDGISAGKAPDVLLLSRDDGKKWGNNHHIRPMNAAAKLAKLPKGTTIYSMRHTFASQSILNGANLKWLAEFMGTSIKMLEDHYGKFIAASRHKLAEESAFKLGLPKKKSNVAKLRPAAAKDKTARG